MEAKKDQQKSNIKVEYDSYGRKIWTVVDNAEQSAPPKPPAPEEAKAPGEKRKYKRDTLKGRDYELNIDKKAGKTYLIAKDSSVDTVSPFHCDKCGVTMKDSQSYMDHLNGKRHNRNLGMSMYVEKKGVDSIKRKIKELKKLKEEQKLKKDKKDKK